MREAVKLACGILESDTYKGISEGRIAPTDEILGNEDELDSWIRQTLGSSRTSPAPAASGRTATQWPSQTSSAASAASAACGLLTRPSCPRSPAPTQRHRHNDRRAGGGLGGRELADGVFHAEVSIGDTERLQWIDITATVDTRTFMTFASGSLLRKLGLPPNSTQKIRTADGSSRDMDLAYTWIRASGREMMTYIVFNDEETELLWAVWP